MTEPSRWDELAQKEGLQLICDSCFWRDCVHYKRCRASASAKMVNRYLKHKPTFIPDLRFGDQLGIDIGCFSYREYRPYQTNLV